MKKSIDCIGLIFTKLIILMLHCQIKFSHHNLSRGRGRDRMVVGITTIPMHSVPITTDGASSNLDRGKVYNIM